MKNAMTTPKNLENENFRVLGSNSEESDGRERLRIAIKRAGGNKVVAQKSGVPIATLGGYIAGRDMKQSSLIALARACGVNVGWLAAGEGPMLGEPVTAPVLTEQKPEMGPNNPGAAQPLQRGAFATIDVDILARSMQSAQAKFSEAGKTPNPRELAQVTLLLYDVLKDAEKNDDEDITKEGRREINTEQLSG